MVGRPCVAVTGWCCRTWTSVHWMPWRNSQSRGPSQSLNSSWSPTWSMCLTSPPTSVGSWRPTVRENSITVSIFKTVVWLCWNFFFPFFSLQFNLYYKWDSEWLTPTISTISYGLQSTTANEHFMVRKVLICWGSVQWNFVYFFN